MLHGNNVTFGFRPQCSQNVVPISQHGFCLPSHPYLSPCCPFTPSLLPLCSGGCQFCHALAHSEAALSAWIFFSDSPGTSLPDQLLFLSFKLNIPLPTTELFLLSCWVRASCLVPVPTPPPLVPPLWHPGLSLPLTCLSRPEAREFCRQGLPLDEGNEDEDSGLCDQGCLRACERCLIWS